MRSWLLALLAVALAGCAGYKLGPTNGSPAGSRSVLVKPFVNKTYEPRLADYIGMSLRQQFQRDGTFRVETQGAGDILVSGEITRFQRGELSYQPNDVLTPQEYTLTVWAHVVAFDTTTGKTNLDRVVLGRTAIRVGADLSSAEREAMPILADDLARNTVALLADGAW